MRNKISHALAYLIFCVLGFTSKTYSQKPRPRYCNNMDLSAFCVLDNHFKIMTKNQTIEYYPKFKEIIDDIFFELPWLDDDEDTGFPPKLPPNSNATPPIPRGIGKSVFSYQDMCDLKRVLFKTSGAGPEQFSQNPYYLDVTEINVNDIRLHNHLHFRIYSKDKERDGKNKATGKIKYAFIIVHDQNGWAVGDFDTGVPCESDCTCTLSGTPTCHQGEFENTIPCMFTSKTAVTHPGQMMIYGGTNGIQEIHATWRFAQSTSPDSFTKELHIKALLIEDKAEIKMERDCRINYRFTNMFPLSSSKQCGKDKVVPCTNIPRTGKFGWTAQYNILWPTLKTLGAWDHFPRGFIKKKSISCHNPLPPEYYYAEPYPTYPSDLNSATLDKKDLTCKFSDRYELGTSGPSLITGALSSLYSVLTWKSDIQLYHGVPPESIFPPVFLHQPNQRPRPTNVTVHDFTKFPKLKDIAVEERCRCPRKGTPPPPPNKRAPPVGQLEGRKDHAIQMTIAWIVLIPFAIFASRYYKETYSKVFFLQEFWWYTLHVLSLMLAAMFMIGGIYAIEIKRSETFNFEDKNQMLHVILGSLALLLFALHILFGHQRLKKPELRRIQIFFHWLFGILEYFLALFSMLNSAWIHAGCMSCPNFWFVVGWVCVQIVFYIIMEIHMRKVDKELNLVPKRSYLPPPVMRLFHVSAPGGKFRIIMLIAYMVCCVIAYGIMHYYIEYTKAYKSCFAPPNPEFEKRIVQYQPN